jgi:hypothetical protein
MAAIIVFVVLLLAFSGASLPPPNISNLRQRTRH